MQRSGRFSLLPLHQDPLLEVSSDTLTIVVMIWESRLRDPFHHIIAEHSEFCASLDNPEFRFEGAFLLFFLLPLLALVVLYISMGLTISRCKFTTSSKTKSKIIHRSANQDVRSSYCSTRRSVPQATNPCSTSNIRYEEAMRKAEPRAGEGSR